MLPSFMVHGTMEIKQYKKNSTWVPYDLTADISVYAVMTEIEDSSRLRCMVAAESLDWADAYCYYNYKCYLYDLATGNTAGTSPPAGQECYRKKSGNIPTYEKIVNSRLGLRYFRL